MDKEIAKYINRVLTRLRKEIPENKNLEKMADIVEKILYFNNKQKSKGCPLDRTCLKILILKQILQRLPIALAQVKTGNIYGNLLNEIHQITYSLYRAKKITKKVYNNIMDSMKL